MLPRPPCSTGRGHPARDSEGAGRALSRHRQPGSGLATGDRARGHTGAGMRTGTDRAPGHAAGAGRLASLLEQLQVDERGLARAVKRVLPADGETELVLIIDQFEELFTLTTDETLRTHVLQSLRAAVLDPHSRLRVIVTLRADFTDRP